MLGVAICRKALKVPLGRIVCATSLNYSTNSSKEIDAETLEIQKRLYKEELIRQACMKRGSKFYPMHLEPFRLERDRLALGMTDEDRALRKQWLDDQVLSPREPVFVPEWNHVNIFRRAYRWPYDNLTKLLRPILGETGSENFRFYFPKIMAAYLLVCTLWYHMKYVPKNWTNTKGIRFEIAHKPAFVPGQPEFYDKSLLTKDFGMEDFGERKVFLGDKIITSAP